MYNDLTAQDIEKMKEEIEYRKVTLRYELLEEVKRTRAFGDLSENFEYKEAKRKKNQNESRIRYLTNMIKTAHIIENNTDVDTVGLYDTVDCYMSDIEEVMQLRVVTTVRTDAASGLISNESPIGKKLLGARLGDVIEIDSPDGKYDIEIRAISKASGEDADVPINKY
ncbi:MAG: GreA/GreB family elongation factor [Clostridia bacterium]|nr:GreA/GreB family elongation factor [Clostridia bacterium]